MTGIAEAERRGLHALGLPGRIELDESLPPQGPRDDLPGGAQAEDGASHGVVLDREDEVRFANRKLHASRPAVVTGRATLEGGPADWEDAPVGQLECQPCRRGEPCRRDLDLVLRRRCGMGGKGEGEGPLPKESRDRLCEGGPRQ
jgi:hypothetical protein